jgi:hypothetical protein
VFLAGESSSDRLIVVSETLIRRWITVRRVRIAAMCCIKLAMHFERLEPVTYQRGSGSGATSDEVGHSFEMRDSDFLLLARSASVSRRDFVLSFSYRLERDRRMTAEHALSNRPCRNRPQLVHSRKATGSFTVGFTHTKCSMSSAVMEKRSVHARANCGTMYQA